MCFLSASISLLIMRSMTTKTKEFCDCSSACLWLYNFLSSFSHYLGQDYSSFVKLRCGFCLALLCIGLKLCKTLFCDRMWTILTSTCSTVSFVNHKTLYRRQTTRNLCWRCFWCASWSFKCFIKLISMSTTKRFRRLMR